MSQLYSMLPGISILALLTIGILALASYRHMIARKQEFHLHVSLAEEQDRGQQDVIAAKVEVIDKWGKILTIVTFVYFLALLAFMMYREWTTSATRVVID